MKRSRAKGGGRNSSYTLHHHHYRIVSYRTADQHCHADKYQLAVFGPNWGTSDRHTSLTKSQEKTTRQPKIYYGTLQPKTRICTQRGTTDTSSTILDKTCLRHLGRHLLGHPCADGCVDLLRLNSERQTRPEHNDMRGERCHASSRRAECGAHNDDSHLDTINFALAVTQESISGSFF